MPVIPAGGGKKIRSSGLSLATKQVWGQPGLYKTVSGKQNHTICSQMVDAKPYAFYQIQFIDWPVQIFAWLQDVEISYF